MATFLQPTVSGTLAPHIRRRYGGSPFRAEGDLLALAFDADEMLWSVEEPGTLRCWDFNEGRQISWFPLEEAATLWTFSPGANLLAAGSDELSIWEVSTGEIQASWPQKSWVTAMAFRFDRAILATGHDDGIVRIWDWESQELVKQLRRPGESISALRFLQ